MKIKKSGCKLHYDPKVSIISPCYNGENYLPHFLDSLLCQDYRNVEFIFVDDGSTDKTREVFERYRDLLEHKGWTVIYIYQTNQGPAAAINTALKKFTGKYLIFPDSDDILYPHHIRSKVSFMEENEHIGIAYCPIDYVYEDNIDFIFLTKKPLEKSDMFKNLINDRNIIWPPIGNIIRTSMFLDANKNREIPLCRGGQNCQMQMPILYKYPYGTIDTPLAKYVIRKNSHSRSTGSFLRRQYDLAEIWIKSIHRLPCNHIQKSYLYSRVILRHIIKIFISSIPRPIRHIYKHFIKRYVNF